VVRSIYELKADSLKNCFAVGKDRPKAFESKSGSGHTNSVLKRGGLPMGQVIGRSTKNGAERADQGTARLNESRCPPSGLSWPRFHAEVRL
jgi:hypothetical protein